MNSENKFKLQYDFHPFDLENSIQETLVKVITIGFESLTIKMAEFKLILYIYTLVYSRVYVNIIAVHLV